jgi:hypothetical protein
MAADLAKHLEGLCEYLALSAICPCKQPSLAAIGTDGHGQRLCEPFDLRFCRLRSIPHLLAKGRRGEEPVAHRLNRCPVAGFHLTRRLHLYCGGKDLKAGRAPQPDGRCIGFDDRIELLRAVAIRACWPRTRRHGACPHPRHAAADGQQSQHWRRVPPGRDASDERSHSR